MQLLEYPTLVSPDDDCGYRIEKEQTDDSTLDNGAGDECCACRVLLIPELQHIKHYHSNLAEGVVNRTVNHPEDQLTMEAGAVEQSERRLGQGVYEALLHDTWHVLSGSTTAESVLSSAQHSFKTSKQANADLHRSLKIQEHSVSIVRSEPNFQYALLVACGCQ